MSQSDDYNPGDSLSESSEDCSYHQRSKHSYMFLRQRVTHQSNILTVYIVQQSKLWIPYRIEKGMLSPKELFCWLQEDFVCGCVCVCVNSHVL